MEKNRQSIYKNKGEGSGEESFFKQKKYTAPTLNKIGFVQKITLSGGTSPIADSGTTFTS